MKHINICISLLCMLVLLACFSGCAVQEALPPLPTGGNADTIGNTTAEDAVISLSAVVASGLSDSPGGDVEDEIAGFKPVRVEDASAPGQITVTFNGKTYTGEYDHS